jgi:hypothetical protein
MTPETLVFNPYIRTESLPKRRVVWMYTVRFEESPEIHHRSQHIGGLSYVEIKWYLLKTIKPEPPADRAV